MIQLSFIRSAKFAAVYLNKMSCSGQYGGRGKKRRCHDPKDDHSLFCLFAVFNAYFALVQSRRAVLTTKISPTAGARHECHSDSAFDFASITLSGAAGFGHRYVSSFRLIEFPDIMSVIAAMTAPQTRCAVIMRPFRSAGWRVAEDSNPVMGSQPR